MSLHSWRQAGPFLVGGHRGASLRCKENTLAALRAAFADGADFVETDLRLTRDGVAVAAHDATLARLAGDDRAIADLDLAEIRSLQPDAMTIAAAIRAAGEGGLLLDTKITDPAGVGRAAGALADLVADGRTAFGVRSLEAAHAVRRILPGCPVLGLFADASDYEALAAMGGDWARLWQADATPEAIGRLADLGLRVLVMAGTPTPDGVGLIDADGIDRLIAAGADGLMLNDPRLAVARRAALRHPI